MDGKHVSNDASIEPVVVPAELAKKNATNTTSEILTKNETSTNETLSKVKGNETDPNKPNYFWNIEDEHDRIKKAKEAQKASLSKE